MRAEAAPPAFPSGESTFSSANASASAPPNWAATEGGVADLTNGSRVVFGQGAIAENGDITLPGPDGKSSVTIPAEKIARVESTDGLRSWKRPPSNRANTTPTAGRPSTPTPNSPSAKTGNPSHAQSLQQQRDAARVELAAAKAKFRRLNVGLASRLEFEGADAAQQSPSNSSEAVESPLMGGAAPSASGPSPAGDGRAPLSNQAPPGAPPVGTKVRVRSRYGKDFGEGTIVGYDTRGRAVFDKPLKQNVRRVMLSTATLTPIIQPISGSFPPQSGMLVAQPADLPGLPRIGTKWEVTGKQTGNKAGEARVAGYDATGRLLFDKPLAGGQTGIQLNPTSPRPGPGGAWPDNVLPSIEALELSTGAELKMLKGPQTRTQQDTLKFAESLGLRALFTRFPPDMGFNGFAVDRHTILLDANQTGIDLTWYLAAHEIAHGTGFDTSIQIDDVTAEKWRKDYLYNHLAPNSDYWTYLQDNPQYHRQEAVAHMVGWFMQDPRFRRKLEIVDRSLWRRLAQAVLNFFVRYELPPEGQKVLDAIKARQNEVQAHAEHGTAKPPGDPSNSDDGSFHPGTVPGAGKTPSAISLRRSRAP